MKIRIRTSSGFARPTLGRGYRIQPTSFVFSIAFHVVVVTGLLMLPRGNSSDQAHNKPIYEQLIQPEEKKIVWYTPPKKQLPDVSAQQRIGTFPQPRAPRKSSVAIIATAPKPKSVKQFIWQPVPKIQIHQDVPAPNLIARAAMAIPAPPPPPKFKPPKIPAPVAKGVKAPIPNISLPAPNGDLSKAAQVNTQPVVIFKPKFFVPPPPSEHPHLVIPVQTADVPLPNANITGTATVQSALPEGIGAPTFSDGAPPPPSNAPPGPADQAGNGKVDIAVVGLHPSDKGAIPNGARPGQFAQAPTVGEVATGEVKGGFGVPNLTIHNGGDALAPKVEGPRKIVLYADRLRSLPVATLSVPLKPATRTIPPSIESRFQGRDVFTMVIPIENMPEYTSDWIIWFAQHSPKGDAAQALNIRAPIPLRKFESVQPVPPGARTDLRVQLAGMITKEGKLEVLALLRNLNPALASAVLQDAQSWEFKPATRDGAPVDVDVVLEIPFSLPPQIARNSALK